MTNAKRRFTAVLMTGALGIGALGFAAPAVAAPSGELAVAVGKLAIEKKTFKGGKASIEGAATLNSTLTAKVSGLKPEAWASGVVLKYQWLRDGSSISGAKDKTYKITSADVGHRISVSVKATKDGYTAKNIVSDKTAAIPAPPPPRGTRGNPYNFGETITMSGVEIRPFEMDLNLAPNGGADLYFDAHNLTSSYQTLKIFLMSSSGHLCYLNKNNGYDQYYGFKIKPNQMQYAANAWVSECGAAFGPSLLLIQDYEKTLDAFIRLP